MQCDKDDDEGGDNDNTDYGGQRGFISNSIVARPCAVSLDCRRWFRWFGRCCRRCRAAAAAAFAVAHRLTARGADLPHPIAPQGTGTATSGVSHFRRPACLHTLCERPLCSSRPQKPVVSRLPARRKWPKTGANHVAKRSEHHRGHRGRLGGISPVSPQTSIRNPPKTDLHQRKQATHKTQDYTGGGASSPTPLHGASPPPPPCLSSLKEPGVGWCVGWQPPPPPSAHRSVLESANPAWTRSVLLDAPGQRHGQQPVSGTADPRSSQTGQVIWGLR